MGVGDCGKITVSGVEIIIFSWARSSDLGLAGADLQIGIWESEDPRPGAL